MASTKRRKDHVYRMVASPMGNLKLVASTDGLAAILWDNEDPRRVRLNIVVRDDNHPILLEAARQLQEYFDGRRKAFNLKLDVAGSEFQKTVWRALLTIPFGETRSYAEIAKQIGRPDAVRAVGAANGKNPIAIVMPCHRLLGSRGELAGFAGGLEAKARLLDLEGSRAEFTRRGRAVPPHAHPTAPHRSGGGRRG